MRPVHIIGVSLDLGGNRRGVDMGPSAFRIAGLGERLTALGDTVVDAGDLVAPIPETQVVRRSEQEIHPGDRSRLREVLQDVRSPCSRKEAFPLVLGGDHSLAAGSVAATADFLRRDGRTLGLIWVDAHGDMNTPASSAAAATFTACRSRRCSARSRPSSRASAGSRPRSSRNTPCSSAFAISTNAKRRSCARRASTSSR